MKRYSEYKDSGVKWIGEIPGHWKCCKLKYFTRIKSGDALTNNALSDTGKYKVYGGGDFMGFYDKYNVDANTILIGRVGARCGCVTITEEKAWATDNALILIHFNINTKFLTYLLVAANLNSLSISNAQPLITGSKVKDSFISIPPIEEQEAIVTYLDSKVAKIDEYISIAEKKIAALEELKQTIIAEAVTRGIHKEVPMKDSGVKWIGMIPEHWKVIRIKYIGKTIGGLTYTPEDITSENNGVIVLRSSNIKENKLCFDDNVYVKKKLKEKDYIKQGDLLICSRNGSADLVGKCAVIEEPIIAAFGAFMMVLRPTLTNNSKYVYYLSQVCIEKYKATFKTSTINQLTNSLLGNIYSAYADDVTEQQEIVTYLDSKAAKIDQLCQAERSQIEKLKEYKQRLISDVVTGKVKVTND